ncbi:MAG: hypothetical protein HYX49_04715 [Chloroflexi bacterium]|nr:hypothetical protein [Chloroflexota bacterium]
MSSIIFDMLGWLGAILFLAAYALVSAKKVEGDSALYQGANILAGILLVLNTLYLRAYPSLVLNAAWIGIGLFALGNKWLSKKG